MKKDTETSIFFQVCL